MDTPKHSLRYIDREHAYCICGAWSLVIPKWSVASDISGMERVEKVFAIHVGTTIRSTATTTQSWGEY